MNDRALALYGFCKVLRLAPDDWLLGSEVFR